MDIKIQGVGGVNMNNLSNISGMEFKQKLVEGSEVCVLANALVKNSPYSVNDLSSAKDNIRQKFIEEAEKLIKSLNEHNLYLVHKSKMVV
jgi:hypothetical protein